MAIILCGINIKGDGAAGIRRLRRPRIKAAELVLSAVCVK